MKKKILHIITSIDNGGAENHLYDLISKQVNNCKVSIIYFKGNDYHRKNLVRRGAEVFKINFFNKNIFFFVINFFKVAKIYKEIKPEIVHCHLWLSEIYGLFLKLVYPKSFLLVISKHLDSYIFEGSFGTKNFIRGIFLEKIIFHYSNYIIFISKAVQNFFLKKIIIKKKIFHYLLRCRCQKV